MGGCYCCMAHLRVRETRKWGLRHPMEGLESTGGLQVLEIA